MSAPSRWPLAYVEAPELIPPAPAPVPAVYLSGGIARCANWQQDTRRQLMDLSLIVLNPRRARFPVDDAGVMREQNRWQHAALRRADLVLFWFPAEWTQPFALMELGSVMAGGKPLAVGVDDGYPRRLDVIEQLRLSRPEVTVQSNVRATVAELRRLVQMWQVRQA